MENRGHFIFGHKALHQLLIEDVPNVPTHEPLLRNGLASGRKSTATKSTPSLSASALIKPVPISPLAPVINTACFLAFIAMLPPAVAMYP